MKRLLTIILAVMMLVSLSGCGEEDDVSKNEQSTKEYLRSLEAGKFYVRHQNQDQTYTCTPVYFGTATFAEGDIVSHPDNARVMWYKEDFEKIPTLYAGDDLIMYTNEMIEDAFYFERFEDYGYTIGFCGLTPTNSRRYQISTDVEDRCTYPDGDTDIVLTYENEQVLLDKLGGIPIRSGSVNDDEAPNSYVTRSGTLRGLTKDAVYPAEIYEGTILHSGLQFVANVHAFGSWEVTESNDFEFEQEHNIIILKIPEFFNTGYYSINGVGLFRYVNGTSADDKTNYNVENEVPELTDDSLTKTNGLSTSTYKEENSEESAIKEKDNTEYATNDIQGSTFEVQSPGEMTIKITFTIKDGYGEDGDGLDDPSAVLTYPSGDKNRELYYDEEEYYMYLTFNATETGVYEITYFDLGPRVPNIEIITD